MQSSAVMLPLSGVLQNFSGQVCKELLFPGRYPCCFKSIMWCFRTGCCCPKRLPLFSLPYCTNTKHPFISTFFYLKVTCSELSSSTRVLCTMHNQLLPFFSFHHHIDTFSFLLQLYKEQGEISTRKERPVSKGRGEIFGIPRDVGVKTATGNVMCTHHTTNYLAVF